MALDFSWDIGRKAGSVNGEATREGGYIHCPDCGVAGLYFESWVNKQVCTACGTEFEDEEIAKPIITVKR